MKLEHGTRLVMIGDSITDCERKRPVGEGRGGYGNGYVSLIHAHLGAVCPERRIRVFNMGIGGNTVRDLKARWTTDVVELRPDWLSVMIGINDVWRQFDSPLQPERHVLPGEYAETLEELVAGTRPTLRGLVLMTPFYIEPNAAEPMRKQMDAYGAVVKEVAARHDAIAVDTQAAYNAVLEHVHPGVLAQDRVHPTLTGHLVLARAWLKAVEAPL